MNKPIIFLDFDGVINTFYWVDGKLQVNTPSQNKVSNYQAICWLNELYTKFPYDIVVTSTWRHHGGIDYLSEVLYNSGLSKEIKVIGVTPILYQQRGFEIEVWLEENDAYDRPFLILDDDSDMCNLMPYLIRCDNYLGITLHEYSKMREFFEHFEEGYQVKLN